MIYARLCAFYGWTHEEVGRLNWKVAVKYYKAITHIEAERNLINMNIADYPRMTKEGRKKFYKEMSKLTYKGTTARRVSFESFIGMFSGGKD